MCRSIQTSPADQQYRKGLGQFATGVAIVTTRDPDGNPVGMTINSFSSVSLHPRLVSWCLDRRAASYTTFCNASQWRVSILSHQQQALAQRFACRGSDKFQGLDCPPDQPPEIPGCLAWFDCNPHQTLRLGDHLMLIGQVQDFQLQPGDPLLFAKGQFNQLASDARLTQSA